MNLRRKRTDDTGATLMLVLIIITVVAVVGTAVLSLADTNVRATVALRDQSGAAYSGDGAAQIAVNALRKSTFANETSSKCFGSGATSSDTLPLPGFYPGTNGQQGSAASSAAVTCTPQAGTGAQGSPVIINQSNRPGQAIYTHSTLDFGDAASETDYVRGSVSAVGGITVKGNLAVTGTGSTLTTSGACPPASSRNIPCTSPATGADPPGLTAPSKPAAAAAPVCPTNKNGPEVFTPGTYNTLPELYLSVVCSKGPGWLYFKPGLYFFDNIGTWTIGGTTLVAGTLDLGRDGTGAGGTTVSPASTMVAPAVPGACVNPIKTQAAVGVQLVMSGSSAMVFNGSETEFCASYSMTSIPTVMYALPTSTGTVISTKSGSKPDFFFQGFVYAPQANINLSVNNASQPFMNFGVVANTLHLGGNPSITCVGCPFINLPDNSPGFGTTSTIVNLSVYVCPGASTCSSSGHLQMTARVLIYDSTGSPVAGARQMKILSWSQQR
jgi:hypothetical protein